MSDILVGHFTAAKLPVNQIQVPGHGLLNGDTVRFALGAVENALPVPLVADTWYYVVNATGDTFQVAATSGGEIIVLTTIGTGSNEAWSPAPTKDVWVYEILTSNITVPDYMPSIEEMNSFAQRGWELKFMGQGTLESSKFWFLMQKQEPPAPITRATARPAIKVARKRRKKNG